MGDLSYSVFRYLNAEHAALYQGIMQVFVEAKERFAINLKPEDVLVALPEIWESKPELNMDLATIEAALIQLKEWGNLKAHTDSAEYRTLADFKRTHFLYQLSAEGEAAEQALAVYRETIETPGELQSVALEDILRSLSELTVLLEKEPYDLQKLRMACDSLYVRFEGLAARARQFMGAVQRAIDLQEGDVHAFLTYKDRLIGYLKRFIGELIVRSPQIAVAIQKVEAADISSALDLLAKRDAEDHLDASDPEAFTLLSERWHARWLGLRAWFFGRDGEPSQSERLRTRALSAIPDLLSVVAALNARRVQRSDRDADYRELARWFAECESDAEAHRLWRTAFGLNSSRHLTIDSASLDRRGEIPVSPRTSWLEAEPLWISPHLRKTGKVRRYGRQPTIVDDTDAQALLAGRLAEETKQFARVRTQVLAGELTSLSDFRQLERGALDLFLDCLGAALAAQPDPDTAVDATSSDGALSVRLEPVVGGTWVSLETSTGLFHGRDCRLRITETVASAMEVKDGGPV